jgi:hypothetical protein
MNTTSGESATIASSNYLRYHKWVGENWYDRQDQIAAETRCVLEFDVGYTKADHKTEQSFFCIHFARGCCAKV